MVTTQSGLHKVHDSPKGLQMDRLMDVWTDENGGVYMKGIKNSKKKKKRCMFMSECIFPAV